MEPRDLLGHELIQTLANVQEIHQVSWDSLGQTIAIAVGLGSPGKVHRCFVTLHPEAARDLLPKLQRVLAEKGDAGLTRQ